MAVIAFGAGVVLGVVLAIAIMRSARGRDDELLERFAGEMRELEAERGRLAGALTERMQALSEEQGRVAVQAQSLATALRRPGVRGRWGETTLRNVVEACGLAEHVDFETQAHFSGDEGAARPDLVVRLPGAATVVVDAKVPLDAYLDAAEERDDAAADALLDRHVGQMRAKVAELAGKAYWQRLGRTPQMVVMFVASEAAVSAAAQRDPRLLSDAAERKVMIATPTTMTALLHVVALGWREEAISEHAENVRNLGVELARRLTTFADHLGGTGRGLEAAVRAHNEAVGSFESRLMPTVRKIGEMGIAEADALEAPAGIERAVRASGAEDEHDSLDPE